MRHSARGPDAAWLSNMLYFARPMPKDSPSIAALVLAFSRFEYLKQLISALRAQTRRVDEIIVVYQGSSNEIGDWLAAQKDLYVVRQENRGSAGGFCTGLELAIRRGHDWTWVFDDDAVPELNALEELVTVPAFRRPETVFLASRIVDPLGQTYMSPTPADPDLWYGTVLEEKCVEVVQACWLGLLVRSRAVLEAGLPIAEFFLWEEDLEFTSRLARRGKGYCAVSSVVRHFQDTKFDPFGKDFIKYAHYARNNIARPKVEPLPPWRICLRSMRRAAGFLSQVARREAPARTLPWIFEGLFVFHPKVRYLDLQRIEREKETDRDRSETRSAS